MIANSVESIIGNEAPTSVKPVVKKKRVHDPLHGITIETIVTDLRDITSGPV